MDEIKEWHTKRIIEKLKGNLEKRNMELIFLEKKELLEEKVKDFVTDGDIISFGGSTTLEETGILDFFRRGNYDFLDRDTCKTREEKDEIYRKAYFADHYF